MNSSVIHFFFIFTFAFCQNQNGRFVKYSLDEGLSQVSILTIVQDSQGYIWFGTQDGLNKFDGYTFTVYRNDVSDTTSLSDNYILSLFLDTNNRLWIGTRYGGLNLYNRKKNSFKRFMHVKNNHESISSNTVNAIQEDKKKNIWLGTNTGLNKLTFESTFERLLYKKDVASIVIDERNHIWVSDRLTISKLKLENSSYSNEIYTNKYNLVINTFVDVGENHLVGTNRGLYSLINDRFVRFPIDQTINNSSIKSILKINNSVFWIGHSNGISKYNKAIDEVTHYKYQPNNTYSLSSNSVNTLFEDKDNNIWVGTNLAGLNLFNNRSEIFQNIQHNKNNSNSLSNNLVCSIIEDENKNIWIGTFGSGLNKYDQKTKKHIHFKYSHNDRTSISNNKVLSVFQDSKKNIWVGTLGGGLNKLIQKKMDIINFNILKKPKMALLIILFHQLQKINGAIFG